MIRTRYLGIGAHDLHRAAAIEYGRVAAIYSGATRADAERYAAHHGSARVHSDASGLHKGPEDA